MSFYKQEVFMNGKVNIVFGLLYFAATALLGPVLLVPGKGGNFQKMAEATRAVEKVRTESAGGAPSMESLGEAVTGIMDYLKDINRIGFVKSAAHAHGNLEALLNVVAGLVILTLVVPSSYKTVLSLLFLIGAVFHSGMLYLVSVFGIRWAGNLTFIGAVAIIAGLVLLGAASIVGIRKAG